MEKRVDEASVDREGDRELVIHARALREEILDHPELAAPGVDALLGRAREGGDEEAAAIVLNAVAHAHRVMGRHAEALACAERALAHGTSAGSVPEQVRSLVNRAMVRLESGEGAGARADLAAARTLGPLDPALALAGGVVAAHTGEVALAIALASDLLARAELPPTIRLAALNNLGGMLVESRPDEAARHFREALALCATAGPMYRPILECNLGLALAQSGAVPEALAAFERAHALAAERDLGGYAAELDLEIARVLGQLRLLPEARAAVTRALGALAGDGGALIRADALVTAARLAVADGDAPSAGRLLSEAHDLYSRQDRPAGVAISALELLALDSEANPETVAAHADRLTRLGLVRDAARGWLQAASSAATRGDSAAAQHYWLAAAGVPGGDVLHRREADARAAAARGDVDRVAAEARAALALIDARSALASAPDLRHRIAAQRAGFEQMLRQGSSAGTPAEFLDVILRGRPPAAYEHGESDPDDEAGAAAERDLRVQWRELARRVDSADEDPATLVVLGARLADTERRLRAGAWAAAAAQAPAGSAAYGLTELAAHAGCPLLALVRVGEDLLAVHHDPGGTQATTLGAWSRVVAELAQLERGLARVASGGGRAAYEGCRGLASALDGALGEVLPPDGGELLVLLDRGLDAAALAALPRLWSRRVRFASLALTSSRRDSAVAGSARALVAVGPRLEHADREGADVCAVWDTRGVRSCADVRARLPHAGIVHLAAHANLRWDNPLQSVIQLADGPLALAELCDLAPGPARTRLLYLSACSLGAAPSDSLLVGAVPMLAERVAREVVAASIPLPDAHAPAVAAHVHAAVAGGRDAACGLALARAEVDPADPGQAGLWAALCCLSVTTAVP